MVEQTPTSAGATAGVAEEAAETTVETTAMMILHRRTALVLHRVRRTRPTAPDLVKLGVRASGPELRPVRRPAMQWATGIRRVTTIHRKRDLRIGLAEVAVAGVEEEVQAMGLRHRAVVGMRALALEGREDDSAMKRNARCG